MDQDQHYHRSSSSSTDQRDGELQQRRGAIAVIRRREHYLVIRRSKWESAPGKICFPGGSVEPGESEWEALVREVYEEVGIADAKPIRRVWECQSPSGILLGWWLTEIAENAVPHLDLSEVAEFFWWSADQMRACADLLPTNRIFLDTIAIP